MYFTQEDFKKIEKWLLQSTVKDTQFADAATPLKGNETIAFVQGNQNVKTTIKDFVDQLFLLGVADFLNVTDKYGEKYLSIEQAIQLIPPRSRKIGQVITFMDTYGNWVIYQFQGQTLNQWNNTTMWINVISSIIVSETVPDEEDLTGIKQNNKLVLKFKNKNYSPNDFSGLGRVYLRKNIVAGKNILEQSMISDSDTIYHLQYDYDLNNKSIVLPSNCIIVFEGGSISNGTIIGNDSIIDSELVTIFKNITVQGSFKNNSWKPEWFGAKGDDTTDDTIAIQQAVDTAFNTSVFKVIFNSKTYKITSTISIYKHMYIGGDYINRAQYIQNTPIIHQTENVPILTIKKINGTDVIELITINNIILKGTSSMSNIHGIYYDDSLDADHSGIARCKFDNLQILNCYYGMYFKLTGYVGYTLNYFSSAIFQYNKLGLMIEGVELEGRKPWINANGIDNSYFVGNYNGGIYLKNVGSVQTIDIVNTSFEHNGKDYDQELYKQIGSFAIRCDGGGNRITLDNCYIESNYPYRTTGIPTSSEIVINNNRIVPSDINNNTFCATFITNSTEFYITRSICSLFVRFAVINIYGKVTLIENDYSAVDFGIPNQVRSLVFIDNSNGRSNYSKIRVINREVPYVAQWLNNSIGHIELGAGEIGISGIFEIDTNFPYDTPLNISRTQILSDNYHMWIGKNGLDNNWGISYENPVPSLASAISFAGTRYLKNKKIIVDIVDEASWGWIAENSKVSNIDMVINGNGKTITPAYYYYTYENSRLSFNNCVFNISAPQPVQYGYFNLGNNSVIEFNNCTFNINSENDIAIVRSKSLYNGNVVFKNCTFVSNVDTTKFIAVRYIDCTHFVLTSLNNTFTPPLDSSILGSDSIPNSEDGFPYTGFVNGYKFYNPIADGNFIYSDGEWLNEDGTLMKYVKII